MGAEALLLMALTFLIHGSRDADDLIFLKGVMLGVYIGDYYRAIQGDILYKPASKKGTAVIPRPIGLPLFLGSVPKSELIRCHARLLEPTHHKTLQIGICGN